MLNDELFYGTKMYHQQFWELCEPIREYLGITEAAYLNVNKDATVANIHSNYKWMEGYLEGQHYNLDPHMVHPDNMSEGFSILIINDHYQYQEYNDVLLYEATDKFDYGFTYVKKTDIDFTAFYFTINKSNHKFINTLLNQSKIIKLLIENLDNQVRSSFPELQQNKTHLIPLKGDLFFQQRGIVFHQ